MKKSFLASLLSYTIILKKTCIYTIILKKKKTSKIWKFFPLTHDYVIKNITAEQMIEKLSSQISLNPRLIELLSLCNLKCVAPNHEPMRNKTKQNET